MGAFGSGRHAQHDTTSQMPRLDVRWLQRAGLLEPGRLSQRRGSPAAGSAASLQVRAEDQRLILAYRTPLTDEVPHTLTYAVAIEWTPCHYGGQRAWLRCPVPGCGRRVALLYGGPLFACRHCHDLTYASQREDTAARAARRAARLRQRLGWPAGMVNGEGGKPVGMHGRTFQRLRAGHAACVGAAVAGMLDRARAAAWINDSGLAGNDPPRPTKPT